MVMTVVAALLPVVFVLALGYAAGRLHAFPKGGTAAITELVLDFALPASLFVSTVTVSRTSLLKEAPLFALFCAVVALVWGAMFAVGRALFRRKAAAASLQALVTSFSAVPFYGGAVLGGVLGAGAGVAVGIGSIAVNLVAVPATTIVLSLAGGGKSSVRGAAFASSLRQTATTPYIAAPVLGVVLVLCGFEPPKLLLSPLQLIGAGSSGVGLFVAGLTLATAKLRLDGETALNVAVKLVAMPALFTAAAFGLALARADLVQGVMLAALPSGPIAVLLATRHKIYGDQASSCLAGSTLGFVVTLPLVLALVGG